MKILYIIARSDRDDMNPGKLAAQVSHAASRLAAYFKSTEMYAEWERQADGFGTAIVLDGGDMFDIDQIIPDDIYFDDTVYMGKVIDPTYPCADGTTIPLHTCSFVLVDGEPGKGTLYARMIRSELQKMNLFP